jgi:hypothetical protein
LPFFDDNCCITNFTHYFSFYVHEPPAPEALRGALQNVDSICNLLQTSSIVDELPGKVPWCFCIFLLTRSIALTTCCNCFIH